MLADTSLLLLLLFTNYCTDTSAFRNLNTEAHFRLSYPALFSVLAGIMHGVTQLSLGGLLILVVIRTIQYNTHQMRDKYLHTIYLPALANMSAQFKGLRPYVAQGIVSLFETLARMHARLVDGLQGMEAGTDTGEDGHDEDLMSNINMIEHHHRFPAGADEREQRAEELSSEQDNIYLYIHILYIYNYLFSSFRPLGAPLGMSYSRIT